jgi:N-glycosylase/DNA lyase
MFDFEVDGRGIDFGLCVSTGQVFRWREIESGIWEGVIGGGWWRVSVQPTQFSDTLLKVQSNQKPDDFVRVFGVDRGEGEWFAGVLEGDPGLEEAVRECAGLRLIEQSDPVEVLFSFICSANNHVKRIEGMVGCLAEFGENYAFPSLEVLAGVEGQYLRERGFGYRAERVPACAAQVLGLGGLNWLDDLKGLRSAEAVLELQKLPGVGPKVAECVALFGLGHRDVVPIDTHIWNAVRRRYFPELDGGSLTLGRRRMVGDFMRDRFGQDAGLAHLVLFVDEMRNWRSRR